MWYTLSFKRDLRDWAILLAQIAEMYGGNLNAVNHVPPTSNLYDCAMQLNMIRTGIQKAVEEGTKADRTKVELITNVSHDIKTPLTSIISYVELLKREPDLPPHVMDYIKTISQKADRLNHIVQDVFEVSKAATGNISLDLEDLDIGKLLQQTFGEMDETMRNSGLAWRVDIPDIPLLVHADGQRLYRVFQNLIRNCAQYSLEGSRVYVTLSAQNGAAIVSIRNISKNEITMDADHLTARFVRGDQNRTTEGSGLGLSIAKSFTEACGGRFTVRTDGDLFMVAVAFPLVVKPPSLLWLRRLQPRGSPRHNLQLAKTAPSLPLQQRTRLQRKPGKNPPPNNQIPRKAPGDFCCRKSSSLVYWNCFLNGNERRMNHEKNRPMAGTAVDVAGPFRRVPVPGRQEQPCPLRLGGKPRRTAVPAGDAGHLPAVLLPVPQGTLDVTASTYVLENGEWVSTGEGTISWDEETEEPQDGVFSLIYQENRSFRMALHGKGTSTFCSDPITPSVEPTAFSHSWLSQEVEIRLGQEIPVALFVADSGNQMASFTVEDYFSPEGFGEMDLVQAVTLTFSQEA